MSVDKSALAVVALWWACETALRPVARRRFGQELTDGYPRWRVGLGCMTQVVCFPTMFLAFVLGRQAWLMESFLLVFACSLMQDCARFPRTMGPMLMLHHVACLVGMLVARFAAGPEWRSVFPYFFGGCTALELGSGACNVFWLRWLPPRRAAVLYHLAMTGSNLVAVACVGVWVARAQAHVVTRVCSAAAIAVLVFLRQKESNHHCRVSRRPRPAHIRPVPGLAHPATTPYTTPYAGGTGSGKRGLRTSSGLFT